MILHNNPDDVTVPPNEGTSGAKDVEPDFGFKVRDLGKFLQLALVEERGCLDDIPGADLSGLGQAVNPDPSKGPFMSHGLDLNIATVPDLNENVAPPNDSSRDEADHGSGGSEIWAQHGPNGEVPAVDSQAEVSRKRLASTDIHDSDSAFTNIPTVPVHHGGPGNLDENYEYCVKTIRSLECQGYITEEFRLKLLTWFSLRSTEHERRVVNIYIQTLVDNPRTLARQLVDSFADTINNKRPKNEVCPGTRQE